MEELILPEDTNKIEVLYEINKEDEELSSCPLKEVG